MAAPLLLTLVAAAQATAPVDSPPVTAGITGPKVGQITYVDVDGGVGYSTNPTLSFRSNDDQAYGRISVNAVHSRITTRTTTVLTGYAQDVTYTGSDGSQQAFSLSASHTALVNERLQLFADASASYDKNGQLDTRIIGLPDVPPLPGTVGPPPQFLPSGSDFLTVTGRSYYISAHAGGQAKLSARDALDFSSGVERSIFRSAFDDSDFWSIPASVGYTRQLSPRATVGGRVAFRYTDYSGPESFWTVTPQFTASLLLSERLSLSGAAGVSFASIDNGAERRHSTGVTGNVSLCRSGERSQFCAYANIDQQAATIAGPSRTIGAGLNYSHTIDANSTVQLSVEGSHYSLPVSIISPASLDSNYYRATAAYTRKLGRRWFGGINVAARKITAAGPDPRADFNGSLFIRYRFGDIQ